MENFDNFDFPTNELPIQSNEKKFDPEKKKKKGGSFQSFGYNPQNSQFFPQGNLLKQKNKQIYHKMYSKEL